MSRPSQDDEMPLSEYLAKSEKVLSVYRSLNDENKAKFMAKLEELMAEDETGVAS